MAIKLFVAHSLYYWISHTIGNHNLTALNISYGYDSTHLIITRVVARSQRISNHANIDDQKVRFDCVPSPANTDGELHPVAAISAPPLL